MNEPISNIMIATDVKDDIKAVIKAEVNAEFDNFVLEHLDNVRSVVIDGVEWYVGADVSKELGLDSLGSHLVHISDEDKRLISADERISLGIIPKNNYKGKLYLINENGLKVLMVRKCTTKKKYEIARKCEMQNNKNKRDNSSSQYDNITHDFRKDNIHMNNNSLDFTAFSNDEFGRIRTVMIGGEVWFVGKDVADALGYSNSQDALARHVDDEDKNTVVIRDGNKGNPNQIIINESGLYSLIMLSKLLSAKKFK